MSWSGSGNDRPPALEANIDECPALLALRSKNERIGSLRHYVDEDEDVRRAKSDAGRKSEGEERARVLSISGRLYEKERGGKKRGKRSSKEGERRGLAAAGGASIYQRRREVGVAHAPYCPGKSRSLINSVAAAVAAVKPQQRRMLQRSVISELYSQT